MKTKTFKPYPHLKIESKWQKIWQKTKIYQVKENLRKTKRYILDMFPYPSAEGLHVGHPEGYTASDIIARYLRMKGFNVLHPMGWDAFGLPAENDAIRKGIHPKINTARNIKNFKRQIQMLGFSYDWSREINTTDPEYYKWTQWLFLIFFRRGLAYEAEVPINWCPSCKTGLANEEVINGACERCGNQVTKKNLRQWMLRITAYAERLLEGLDELDWPEGIKLLQKNWIGRSKGVEIIFLAENREKIPVFTTRPDTLWGVTFLVLAPEHHLVEKITKNSYRRRVYLYKEKVKNKSDLERTAQIGEKTGVFTGSYALNPVNKEKIPIWVADYVLPYYGTGAIMAVPAHDQRDFEFAQKYKLPIKTVIKPPENFSKNKAYEGEGKLINSGKFSHLFSVKARALIEKWIKEKKIGKTKIQYKLRDWVFSRQRYWGEPIPIIHCKKCGTVPVPEKDLPVLLPHVKKYQPTGTGESPLAAIKNWVNTKCPKCKGTARRETNTMPQWAGSCWYFLRFADPHNKKEPFSQQKIKYWLPVDIYIGGAEHAVLHLLYARFWVKVLYDEGLLPFEEPFIMLRNQGLILGPDGQKMSKSRGNVINPDDVVKEYGADTFRMYEMFMGPFDQPKAWDVKGIKGIRRFLDKIWRLQDKIYNIKPDYETLKKLHLVIKKVTLDIENFGFNTAISAMMEFINHLGSEEKIPSSVWQKFLKILAPFAPHLSEELWTRLGFKKSIHLEKWPKYDPNLTYEEKFTLVIQINGKLRDKIKVLKGISKKEAETKALDSPKIQKYLKGKKINKVIFVPNRLINFVIK